MLKKLTIILCVLLVISLVSGCASVIPDSFEIYENEPPVNADTYATQPFENEDETTVEDIFEPQLVAESLDPSAEQASNANGHPYVGDSLYAGLYYLGNDEYQTTDGRFAAKVGQAVMISDGETNIYNSRFAIEGHGLEVTVENTYGFKIQHFFKSANEGWKVGIYDSSKLTYDQLSHYNDGVCTDVYGGTPYIPLSPFLQYHTHYERYVFARPDFTGEITNLTLRVMYTDENTAVFYSCATYKTSPNTVETFVVVPLNTDLPSSDHSDPSPSPIPTVPTVQPDESCWRCGGSGLRDCGVCNGTGYLQDWGSNVPNFDGEYNNNYTLKRCTHCTNGKVKCSTCGGDGKK